MYKFIILLPIIVMVIGLVITAPLHNEAHAESQDGIQADQQSAAGPMSDAWIEAKIESAYLLDDDLSAFGIGVEAEKGAVTLSGEVDSEALRERAARIASEQEGVTAVHNELRLATVSDGGDAGLAATNRPVQAAADNESAEPDAATDESGDDMGESLRDAGITARVKSRLVLHLGLTGFAINVDTEQQVVQLSGTVDEAATILEAEQLAQSTDGVKQVHNLLQVKTVSLEPAPRR